tara:strand:+ start:675 stop:860 length:186 start_codon:yes stop_codon:yes gene_type:complete
MTKEQTLKKIKMLIAKYQRVISQTKNEHTDMILKDIEIDIELYASRISMTVVSACIEADKI